MEYIIFIILAVAFYLLSKLCDKYEHKTISMFFLGMFTICVGVIIYMFIYTYIFIKPLAVGVGLW